MVRKGIWALGAAVIAIALVAALFPVVASTQIVRDRISLEMSTWSGYRVQLGAAPEIEVFPTFRAILNNVTMSSWTNQKERPVIEAERVEVELSALAALAGNVVFSDARMIRPTVRVIPAGDSIFLPLSPGGGRIAQSVDAARAVVAANPTNPDFGALPANPFGTIEFSDGRIVTSQNGEDVEIVTSLAGKVDWTALNRAGRLQAAGIWRGESVSLELSSPNPLVLFAGGAAPMVFAFKSKPTNVGFDGTANLSEKSFLDGKVTFTTPSLRRLLEWSRTAIAPGAAIGSMSVSSHIVGNAQRAKFENTEIELDGNSGMGVLDVSLADTVPSIAGTLAFETLDLRSFLAAFTPLTTEVGDQSEGTGTAFADQIILDLRLSAARATAGSLAMTDVAATAQVKNGLAVLDISDATALGGTLQAGMRFDRKSESDQMEVRLLASDIDGAILGAAAGASNIVPTGKGTISIILKGPGTSWNAMLENADGSVTANFGAGNIAGIDLDAFLKRASEPGFFALGDFGEGALPVLGTELKARISNGVVRIEKAEAKAETHTISLSGLVPYVGGGLVLSGAVYPAGPDKTDAPPEATFFVGGSWRAPFISPILPRLPPE